MRESHTLFEATKGLNGEEEKAEADVGWRVVIMGYRD
jgi:hypothetical protein